MRILRYSPDQPRDENGRFGESGDTAYHVTDAKNLPSILEGGLKTQDSGAPKTNTEFSENHDATVVYTITNKNDAKQIIDNKLSFGELSNEDANNQVLVHFETTGPLKTDPEFDKQEGKEFGWKGEAAKHEGPVPAKNILGYQKINASTGKLGKFISTKQRSLRYSPDQPRDDHGRFGEGDSSKDEPGDYTREQKAVIAAVDAKYPMAGAQVDGRTVRDHVPNFDSINATLGLYPGAYDVLEGTREVQMSEFPDPGAKSARISDLAEQIKASGELNPLIVGHDHGGPYIIEGSHRFDALRLLGAKSFPAVVAIDLTPEGMGKRSRSVEQHIDELVERAAKLADTPGGQPTVVYFMRHGQTDSDKNNLFGGQTLEEMNTEGIADLRAGIADVISKLDFGPVFSDGLPRTHQAAEMVLPYSKSASEVTVSALATAWGCGNLSGQPKTPENVARKRFYVKNPTVVPPSTPDSVGESIQHSEHRWLSFLAYVISLTPPGSASLCTCHSSGIKVISKTYGPRIKVNPGGLVKMEIGATGITFEILRNGLPETIIPDTEDERKRRAAEKRSKGFQDTGTYDEAVEVNRRRIASEMAQYAESGSAFDPAGDYLCKTCTQMDLPKSCGVVATNKINPEDTSCRYWVNDIPLVQLQMKFSPKETGLTSRPNWKGFGCKRCVYGSEAKVPDSKGRPSWCSWFGIHVLPNACCAKNEGDDDVVLN